MRNVIVSFSGGKDSTVAALEAIRIYGRENVQLVFIDTGAEYQGTPEFVKSIATMLELPITTIRYWRDWYEQVEADGMPFTPALRKCTHRLKLDVFNSWLRKNGLLGSDVTLVTGIRREESQSRSLLPQEDIDDRGSKIWRPCLYMSGAEVKERVRAEGLPLHYCYEFSSRCNCAWCIFAGKYEMQAYAEMYPKDYERVCILEEKIDRPLRLDFRMNDLLKQGRLL